MYAGRPGGDGTARTPKQPDRRDVPADEREAYDAVMARFTDRANTDGAGAYFGALLNSPRFPSLLSSTGLTARLFRDKEGDFKPADRDLIDHVLAPNSHSHPLPPFHIPATFSPAPPPQPTP